MRIEVTQEDINAEVVRWQNNAIEIAIERAMGGEYRAYVSYREVGIYKGLVLWANILLPPEACFARGTRPVAPFAFDLEVPGHG